ncbi:hypothetical protein ACHAXT_000462 [Thalassiosira profunda]
MSSAGQPAGMSSNALLTPSEREKKRRLKAELKFQRRVKKLETRIKHAISRSDPVVEQSTREELAALLLTKKGGGAAGDHLQRIINCPSKDPRGKAALNIVLDIHRRLLASTMDADEKEKVRDNKIQQTKKARHLLRNMTKGTQSKSMFQDVTTLRGYARQKFHGRASLIVESFGKLSPEYLKEAASMSSMDDGQQRQWTQQMEIMNMCWEKLGRIEKVCSLGCGPGNDAVGLTAFLRSYFDCKEGINEMSLLDYAIDEWKSAVLDDLVPLLVPESAKKMTCQHCDITGHLSDECIVQIAKEADIFLTSYLLTETRDHSLAAASVDTHVNRRGGV